MAAGLPLTLYVDAFYATPFDFRCWVALKEKGLEFTSSRVMVTEGQGLTASYRDASITARVPGLAHGDFWLGESQAIVEYLEDTFPPPTWPRLLPADPRARARSRQIMSFMGADLFALIAERPAWLVVYPRARPPLSPAARADALHLMGIVSRLLAAGALEPWSIACADLTFGLLRLARTGEELPPHIQAFVDANVARESVRSYLDHDRPPNPPTSGRRVVA
jgi:glutathione S-transferase